MARGQSVLTGTLDVAVMSAVEGLLECEAVERAAAHGRRLRLVLRLEAVLAAAGAQLGTAAQLALLEQTSEQAAAAVLAQAQLLAGLPGGLDAVECGLLSVEQAVVVARRLLPLDGVVRVLVWHRLRGRLLAALEDGVVLPPARLAEMLAGWVVQADPAGAVERRRVAQQHAEVQYRRRDDGLADLFLLGLSGPRAQAALSRIRDRSVRHGSADLRPVGVRRAEAALDLLLGLDQLALDDAQNPFDTAEHDGAEARPDRCAGPSGGSSGGSCGCRLGEPVPCGVGVTVLIPIGAALGTTEELAVLAGHGPLEPDLAQAVLHTAPVLRPVWIDGHGLPVAVGDRVERPARADPRRCAGRAAAAGRDRPVPAGPTTPRRPPTRTGGRTRTCAGTRPTQRGRPVRPTERTGAGRRNNARHLVARRRLLSPGWHRRGSPRHRRRHRQRCGQRHRQRQRYGPRH